MRHDEFGKWAVLDVEEQHVVALNTMVIMQRAMNRARILNQEVRIPAKYL